MERGYIVLEKINLHKVMEKKEYEEFINQYSSRLSLLQRQCRDAGIPIMILFEGWGAAGKGTLINKLITPLDPRGFKVYTIQKATKEEKLHPYLWRFFVKTPGRGRIHIFDRSYYQRLLTERLDEDKGGNDLQYAYTETVDFEKLLTDDGTVIIKFFLHISKKEQEKRFKKLESSKATAWRVTREDWKHHGAYDELIKFNDEMIAKTDTEFAPWTIIEATDRNYATAKIISTVIKYLEEALDKKEQQKNEVRVNADKQRAVEKNENEQRFKSGVLSHVDLSKDYTREEYKARLKELQGKLSILHNEMFLRRIPVVVAFEGWDAAGKGGAIKRLTQKLDPRGYEVIPISAPNDAEKAHHYLWRFWNAMPKAGHMAIFDRTWYGRVLVERVEGFAKEEEWKRAYTEINRMEETLTNAGWIVVKFWLHIDKEEQERRFTSRQENPEKQWKITDEDWRNREKWEQYEAAVDEMVMRTSTNQAPWVIVEANSKYYARIKVLETIVEAIEKRMKEER